MNLKGHDGKVTAINWSKDDQRLVSCAEDGSLYEWDVSTGRRIHESVIKTCSYNDVTLSPDDKFAGQNEDDAAAANAAGKKSCVIYAVGSDKTVKQIQSSTLLKEVDLHTLTLSSLALSNDGNMLFSGRFIRNIRLEICLIILFYQNIRSHFYLQVFTMDILLL